MDVKRWKVVIDSEDCPHTSSIEMCMLYETDINLSNEHLMDCTHENCPVKHLLTRPDPMSKEDAERLVRSWYNAQCATDAYETQSDALTANKLYKQIIASLTTIPRPDPAEVERLVDELVEGCKKWGYHIFQNQPTQEDVTLFDKISKAKAELLKLVGE